MATERIDQRVLGALRLVDRATALPVTDRLRLRSRTARVVRNLSGLYVIHQAEGLAAHTAAFERPPATPAVGSLDHSFTIEDPARRYLPRRVSLQLPLDPDPAHAGQAGSLFTPRDVSLYPAASAGLSPNWSTLRVFVGRGAGPVTPLRGALLRVVASADERVLASGISDDNGETLVIVPGVPVTRFADENDEPPPGHDHGRGRGHDASPVVTDSLPVRLELSYTESDWPVDPDELERNHAANLKDSLDLSLRTGRMEKAVFTITE